MSDSHLFVQSLFANEALAGQRTALSERCDNEANVSHSTSVSNEASIRKSIPEETHRESSRKPGDRDEFTCAYFLPRGRNNWLTEDASGTRMWAAGILIS
jgi:hypothetical protein